MEADMSIAMSVLAILDEEPSYGLQLKNEFEARTGGVWPLNIGQVYTTLDRLERDGLVRPSARGEPGKQKTYEITEEGRSRLRGWFAADTSAGPPARDVLVLKLVMSIDHPGIDPAAVIQAERRRAVQLLQEYTRLKAAQDDRELGWAFLLESLIFQTEARVRWLDACEARLGRANEKARPRPAATAAIDQESEVLG
jgi:DNA-binding PadR family transcriptional regulator